MQMQGYLPVNSWFCFFNCSMVHKAMSESGWPLSILTSFPCNLNTPRAYFNYNAQGKLKMVQLKSIWSFHSTWLELYQFHKTWLCFLQLDVCKLNHVFLYYNSSHKLISLFCSNLFSNFNGKWNAFRNLPY